MTFAAAVAVTGYVGYLLAFTGFQSYDDEGFLLLALRSFVSGDALYDKIAVQYGPFYFEFFGLFGAAGVSFDNDSGRLVTLGVWLAIALVAGVTVFAFTRNLALGLATQLVTFATASPITAEPMHPAGLLALLTLCLVAVGMFAPSGRAARWSFVMIGALAAAAILTKVNVGGFLAVALIFACGVTYPAVARHRLVRLVALLLFISVPIVLMRADLHQEWARRYAIDVALSALAVGVVTLASPPDARRRLGEVVWLGVGGIVVALVVIAGVFATGTSPNGLLRGLIEYPLSQRQGFEFPLLLPGTTIAWSLVGLVGAFGWLVYRTAMKLPTVGLEGAIRVGVGLFIWVTLLGGLHVPGLFQINALSNRLVLPVALVWVVAAPRGRPDGYGGLDFGRTLLAAVAVMESLTAFPVAGSQVAWSTLMLGVVAAVALGDGVTQLGLTSVRSQLASGLVFAALVVSWLPPAWQQSRAAYAAAVPLDLPGATRIRVPADQAQILRIVSQAIRADCDTFISIPGLDSFYVFAELSPPSPPTRFIWLIGDDPAQRAVVDSAGRFRRLCVVENESVLAFWSEGREIPDGPLAELARSGFQPVFTYGGYIVLARPQD